MAITKFPIPNEEQAELIRQNGMNPDEYMVIHTREDQVLHLQCYKTGDEIHIYPNALKKGRG